jgi:hypothetical protein
MSLPPDKFTNYLDTSTYNSPTAVLNALSAAWASYYATYGEYPNVWVAVGAVVYYGGY